MYDLLTPTHSFFNNVNDLFSEICVNLPLPPPAPPRGASALFQVLASPYGASRSHSLDTPQSVGLIWASDEHVAENSTWQHTTLTTDRHPCPRRVRTRNPSKRAATDLHLVLKHVVLSYFYIHLPLSLLFISRYGLVTTSK
jgi:hypothetical protein